MATNTMGLGLAVRPRSAGRTWPIGRWLLIAAVLGWFGLLILVPSVALLRQVVAGGWRPFCDTMRQPEVLRAFGLSLGITALRMIRFSVSICASANMGVNCSVTVIPCRLAAHSAACASFCSFPSLLALPTPALFAAA